MRVFSAPHIRSAFFESEINFGSEGGLYAELIPNRDFETQGRGTIPGPADTIASMKSAHESEPSSKVNASNQERLDPNEPAANPRDYRPWYPVPGVSATIATDATTQPFATNPMTLRLDCTSGACGGVRNPGYWGIGVESGSQYHLSFYARCDTSVQIAFGLLTADGTVVSTHAALTVAGPWREYTATITGTMTTSSAIFELLVHSFGTVWFDSVSLMPANAVAGLFRADLLTLVKGLQPGFVRLPGGNYLEGTGPRTRWNWKVIVYLTCSCSYVCTCV